MAASKDLIRKQMDLYRIAYFSALKFLNLTKIILETATTWKNNTTEKRMMTSKLNSYTRILADGNSYWKLDTKTIKQLIENPEKAIGKLSNVVPKNIDEIRKDFDEDEETALIKYTSSWKKEDTTVNI